MNLRFSPGAEESIDAADRWWIENRRAAPTLFEDELGLALQLIEDHPLAGPASRSRTLGLTTSVALWPAPPGSCSTTRSAERPWRCCLSIKAIVELFLGSEFESEAR